MVRITPNTSGPSAAGRTARFGCRSGPRTPHHPAERQHSLCHLEQLGRVTRSPYPVNKRIVLIDVTEHVLAGIAEGKRLVALVTGQGTEALGGRMP